LELNLTKDVLEQTQIVLRNVKEQLEEKAVRKAHQTTDHWHWQQPLTTLDETVEDVDGLHAKPETQERA
jgi:hypothetical protein